MFILYYSIIILVCLIIIWYIYIYCVINYSDNIFIPLLYYLSYDIMYKDMISYKGIIYDTHN